MDQNGATRGTSRDLRASQIRSFLTEALADGEETVVVLQEKASAVGLLVEGQSISDAKLFKSAKAALGIRSRRVGFGPGGTWAWALPAPPIPEVTTPVALSVDVYGASPSNNIAEILPSPVKGEGDPSSNGPMAWSFSNEGRGRRGFRPTAGIFSSVTLGAFL
jgi:hypothetical protein